MIPRKFLIIFLLILILPTVSSIGISPSMIEIWYEPNKEFTFNYMIRTKEHESDVLAVYASGDLAENIILTESELQLEPEQWTDFTFDLKLPSTLEPPGLHVNKIGVIETYPESQGGVGVVAGVEMLIYVRVPFPGRYLNLNQFDVHAGEVNKPIEFIATVTNTGKENIDGAEAKMDVKGPDGSIVDSMKTESVPITKKQKKSFITEWQTNKPGFYSVSGMVVYDNNVLELEEKKFRVGELLLEITNTSAAPVKEGEIAQIQAQISSVWNTEIKNVYMELEVTDKNGMKIGESTSQTKSVRPWSTENFIIYWDTQDIEIGDYYGKITAYYEDKTAEGNVIITIEKPFNWILISIIVVVVILILTNIIIYLKRKKKK